MDAEGYNGWSNAGTWLVSLWIGNEEPSYWYVSELAERWAEESREDGGILQDLAFGIFAYVEDSASIAPVVEQATLGSDLLQWALAQVNWQEIAEGYAVEAIGGTGEEARAEITRRQRAYLDSLARR